MNILKIEITDDGVDYHDVYWLIKQIDNANRLMRLVQVHQEELIRMLHIEAREDTP